MLVIYNTNCVLSSKIGSPCTVSALRFALIRTSLSIAAVGKAAVLAELFAAQQRGKSRFENDSLRSTLSSQCYHLERLILW